MYRAPTGAGSVIGVVRHAGTLSAAVGARHVHVHDDALVFIVDGSSFQGRWRGEWMSWLVM
jgi:hypothetical protein